LRAIPSPFEQFLILSSLGAVEGYEEADCGDNEENSNRYARDCRRDLLEKTLIATEKNYATHERANQC